MAEKLVLKVIYAFIPFVDNGIKNYKISKIIKEKNDHYCENELTLEIKTKPEEAPIEDYKLSLQTKDKLEDKAKINAFAVTIASTLIMGSPNAINGAFKNSTVSWLPIVAAVLFALAVLYMVIASVTAFWLIAETNVIYYISNRSNKLDEELRREYFETTRLNNLINTKRNNYVVSSFSCVRIALLCLFLVMILMLSPILLIHGNPTQSQSVYHQNGQLLYSSQATEYIELNGNKQIIEDLVLISSKEGKINVNNPIGLVDSLNNLFVKVESSKDGSILILQIEPISPT